MKFKELFGLGLTLVALNTSAQVSDPDWKETEVPKPPSFNQGKLIPIEMPNYVTLKFGVDPATLTVTPDGIVRYVMVAANATGSVSAMYEGIRCETGEVKTYARYTSSGKWVSIQNPQWQGLNDNLPSKHAMALARQGACDGRSAAANSPEDVINALKHPKHDY